MDIYVKKRIDFDDFEEWDLETKDFKVSVYRVGKKEMRTQNASGVEVELAPYQISVKSHSQNNQMKNIEECLNILYSVLCCYQLK